MKVLKNLKLNSMWFIAFFSCDLPLHLNLVTLNGFFKLSITESLMMIHENDQSSAGTRASSLPR